MGPFLSSFKFGVYVIIDFSGSIIGEWVERILKGRKKCMQNELNKMQEKVLMSAISENTIMKNRLRVTIQYH